MRLAAIAAFAILTGCTTIAAPNSMPTESVELLDASRDRQIPLELYFPAHQNTCTRRSPCPVAFLSQGYGLRNTDYSFIANALARSGYLVAAIQHDLPSDAAISTTGDLFASRTPMWQRGAENPRFVRGALSRTYPGFDWSRLVLIGHSNGGDLSALALQESPTLAAALVTLDNRRYPLPRTPSIKGTSEQVPRIVV
jgi:predicted dienelactone hydrolase